MIARLRAGRQDAMEWFVRGYSAMALSVARGFAGDEEQAREIVKDAMLRALSSLSSLKRGASLAAWLRRIVVDTSVTSMAKKASEVKQDSMIEDLLPAFDAEGNLTGSAAALVPPGEMQRRLISEPAKVRKCISRLPEGYRVVLMLCELGEMQIGETATALGIAPSEVKTRLHRARLALVGLLAEAVGDLGLGRHAVKAS